VAEQKWPEHDEAVLVEDEVDIIVQINGKLRDKLRVAIDANEEELKSAALNLPKIQQHLAGKEVRKVVIVPNKIVNIVAN